MSPNHFKTRERIIPSLLIKKCFGFGHSIQFRETGLSCGTPGINLCCKNQKRRFSNEESSWATHFVFQGSKQKENSVNGVRASRQTHTELTKSEADWCLTPCAAAITGSPLLPPIRSGQFAGLVQPL